MPELHTVKTGENLPPPFIPCRLCRLADDCIARRQGATACGPDRIVRPGPEKAAS